MNNISITLNNMGGHTIIPNLFFDKYMPSANGDFVKVYLYLLRTSNDNSSHFSLSEIADTFNITESDVLRAIKYWASLDLLDTSFEGNQLTSIHILPMMGSMFVNETSATIAKPDTSLNESNAATNSSLTTLKKNYSPTELTNILSSDDMKELLFIAEKYTGKLLSLPDTQTIAYLADELHFSRDLIEYLIEYCVSKNHKSFKYIEKVALAWASEHIDTVTKAKQNTTMFNTNYFKVLKAFGISGRNPAQNEMILMQKWFETYKFELGLILNACNRTISATHQPSFEYADSILSSWHNNHVRTEQDIERLDKTFKNKQTNKLALASPLAPKVQNKFHNFEQRTYDFDALENELLNK